MSANHLTPCPACGADPGDLHGEGCDVERCAYCGGQFASCCCDGRPDKEEPERLPWAGEWPGVAECREFGWYRSDGKEDLNRLQRDAIWDPSLKRWLDRSVRVRYARDEAGPAEVLCGRVARLTGSSLRDLGLSHGVIVRLDRDPFGGGGTPAVAEVLHRPHRRWSPVRFASQAEAALLKALYGAVGSVALALEPPGAGTPGRLLVSHAYGQDPASLADAAGVRQPYEGPEDEGDAEGKAE